MVMEEIKNPDVLFACVVDSIRNIFVPAKAFKATY
jgi:hypothetical protein